MWYNDLRPDSELRNDRYSLIMLDEKDNFQRMMTDEDKKRTILNMNRLKAGIRDQIPNKKVDQNLLLASWNIKNFGRLRDRTPESLYYIAEIISAFDIISVQEINGNLSHFKKIIRLLGSDWKYTLSDVTEGNSGNDERFGFIYDSRRVTHSGLSGEVVIPEDLLSAQPILRQLKRTPSFAGFESGWKKFSILSVHLHPGDDSNGPNKPTDQEIRKEEVKLLIEVLKERMKDAVNDENRNMIILGDTNLYKNDDDIVKLITDEGFSESESLLGKFTNTSLNQIYDRIFLRVSKYFKLVKDSNDKEVGGVFNLFNYVYINTPEEIANYHDLMLEHKDNPATLTSDQKFIKYFNAYWKRNQISDHLPVWLEIETDSSAGFLKNKLAKL
ncbi:endonuclease/exonuclease/phosphatase family protein [Kordia sp. YSTF-M3]|uniref:Endonuclease/exonuclease/phosphatase family protein n=1 Tax=Kordia aestuariivivens TaxID=2759037 RepID=A0ABR7Q950_9FLAO|nr:endonuclease/exonuclease/phosphatase family protein [Kordia aestuariivivens]MBC8755062.1 endonuclease/exonuclease/phosphatase family protein [Kordia aestuariivivens]